MNSHIPPPQKSALYPADMGLRYAVMPSDIPLGSVVCADSYDLISGQFVGAMPFTPATGSMLNHVAEIPLSGVLAQIVFFIVRAVSISVANIKGSVSFSVERLKNEILDWYANLHASSAKVNLHVSILARSLGFNLPLTNINPAVDVVYFPIKGSNTAKRGNLVKSLVSGYISPLFHAFLPSNSVGINHRFITP